MLNICKIDPLRKNFEYITIVLLVLFVSTWVNDLLVKKFNLKL